MGSSNGEYITDENGRIVIEGLEPGVTITAKEIKTLEGYVLDTTPKSIKIKVGEVQTLRFYNQKQGTIVIRKLDKQTNEPLAGVEFQITSRTAVIWTMTTATCPARDCIRRTPTAKSEFPA